MNTPSLREPFIAGMREQGWIEGQNFTIDELLSEGHNERLPGMAAELVRRKVDVIVAAGTPPTAAARNATSTIPIVFFFTGDPVGSGFVASLHGRAVTSRGWGTRNRGLRQNAGAAEGSHAEAVAHRNPLKFRPRVSCDSSV